MYGFVCKTLLDSAGVFRCFIVNFNLQKASAEVNSVYFLSLISLECFLAFRHFYSSSIINSTPWFVFKKITLLARGPRYRKKPPARAANQIAGNHKRTLVVHK